MLERARSIYKPWSFLPFSGFHHFADFALDQIAFQAAEVADVEFAVQMIGLVQEGAGEQFFAGLFEQFSVHVLGANGHFVRARYVLAELWNAQAAFVLDVLALGVNDFGIDENELGVGIFFESYIDDGDAPRNADLRGGQADALGGVHGLEHVVDELLQFFVEGRDFFRGLFEDRIAVLNDGMDHQ